MTNRRVRGLKEEEVRDLGGAQRGLGLFRGCEGGSLEVREGCRGSWFCLEAWKRGGETLGRGTDGSGLVGGLEEGEFSD